MGRRIPERGRLQALVVARLRAGARLKDVCLTEGVPQTHTVQGWARKDPAFGVELRAAIAEGRWMRLYRYDAEKGEALLARARAGERIVDLVGRPGMPSWKSYRYWMATGTGLGPAVRELRAVQLAALAALSRGRRRAFDATAADRIAGRIGQGRTLGEVLAADPALPGRDVVRRWRRENGEFDQVMRWMLRASRAFRQGAASGRSAAAMTDWVCDRILVGGTLNSVAREPGAPSRATLANWVRTQPAFAAAVAQACVDREDWFNDQIDVIEADMAPGMPLKQMRAIKRRADAVRGRMARLRKLRPGRCLRGK